MTSKAKITFTYVQLSAEQVSMLAYGLYDSIL